MRFYLSTKILLLIASFFILLAVPNLSFAQSATSTQDLIAQLQEQIKQLQAQIEELRAQLVEVKAEIQFTRTLSRGMAGDEVKSLQEFLSKFPDVYPEGFVTGYFGPLTEAAVKRWQEKQGIESVGVVGPKTRTKLNELLTEGAGASGVIPPGLLVAPGIQKKIATSTLPSATTTLPIGTTTVPTAATPTTTASVVLSAPTTLVSTTTPDTIAPTISITSPPNGSTISGTVTVSADASDNVGVVGVQFKVDSSNIGSEDTTAAYSVSWNSSTVANGSHTLTALARDAAGNQMLSIGIIITVSNVATSTATSTPPVPVSDALGPWITNLSISPTSGNVGVIVTFSVTAEDSAGIGNIVYDIRYPNSSYVLRPNCNFNGAQSGTCTFSESIDHGIQPTILGEYIIESVRATDLLGNVSTYYPNGTVLNSQQSTHSLTIPVINITAAIAQIDLVAYGFASIPNNVTTGESFRADFYILNNSTNTSPPGKVKFYYAPYDPTNCVQTIISYGEYIFNFSPIPGALATPPSGPMIIFNSGSIVAPPGDYMFVEIVDPGNLIVETNENNNVFCSAKFRVR